PARGGPGTRRARPFEGGTRQAAASHAASESRAFQNWYARRHGPSRHGGRTTRARAALCPRGIPSRWTRVRLRGSLHRPGPPASCIEPRRPAGGRQSARESARLATRARHGDPAGPSAAGRVLGGDGSQPPVVTWEGGFAPLPNLPQEWIAPAKPALGTERQGIGD